MNRLVNVCFAAVMLGSAVSASAADIAGNVALVTDYRFRGIAQDHGRFSPAIQGGFDWASEMGIYVGTWASNVNFTNAAIEVDLYGGYKGKFHEDFAYDVGFLYYGYPQDGNYKTLDEEDQITTHQNHLGYEEFYTSLSAYGGKVGVNYSPNYFGGSDPFWYWYINYGKEVVKGLTVSGHWGYNRYETRQSYDGNTSNDGSPTGFGGPIGNRSYADWSLGVTYPLMGVTLGLTYVDTNISKSACYGNDNLCAATGVFSISKSL
jgi:uncharacterized protein (TIGR02001 family)